MTVETRIERTLPIATPAEAAQRNQLERRLATLWEEALDDGRIGVHDNFFERGGHSLLGARLLTCDWNGLDRLERDVVAAVRAGRRAVLPFTLLAVSDAPDDQLACARAYGRAFDGQPSLPARAPPAGAGARDGRRVRARS